MYLSATDVAAALALSKSDSDRVGDSNSNSNSNSYSSGHRNRNCNGKRLSMKPVAAAVFMAASGASSAATITVNSTADTGAAGICTLRDAIKAANTNAAVNGCAAGSAGADTITFSGAGASGSINMGANGQMVISEPLTISGPGAAALAVDALTTPTPSSRIFDITASTGTVLVSGLTLRNGHAGTFALGEQGGAIRSAASSAVSLTLDSVVVENSTATASNEAGGGVFFQGNTGTASNLTIRNSTFQNNSASNGHGGAIAFGSAANVSITNTRFTTNSARRQGGAIVAYGGAADFDVTGSTFVGNTAIGASGGAIWLTGPARVTLDSTRFDNNSNLAVQFVSIDRVAVRNGCVFVNNAGGALETTASGDVSVTDSDFDDNGVPGAFSSEFRSTLGIYSFSAVGAPVYTVARNNFRRNNSQSSALRIDSAGTNFGQLRVAENLFEKNTARPPSNTANPTLITPPPAGGMYLTVSTPIGTGSFDVANNTFSENEGGYGGGLTVDSVTTPVIIRNNTFIGNKASDVGVGSFYTGVARGGLGGAVYLGQTPISPGFDTRVGAAVFVSNLVSGNTQTAGSELHFAYASLSASSSTDRNFFGAAVPFSGAPGVSSTNSVFSGVAAFAALANNGGRTFTYAIPPTSPAAAGGINLAPALTTDQRGVGFARTAPVTNTVTYGAYQIQAAAAFDPPFITKRATAINATTVEWKITVINNAAANAALAPIWVNVNDPLPAGVTFVAGSVSCTATTAAGNTTLPGGVCGFNAGNTALDAIAQLGYTASTSATSAPERVDIVFRGTVAAGVAVTNTACADLNGVVDTPVCASVTSGGPAPVFPPVPVPTVNGWGQMLLALLLPLIGLWRRRGRSH